MAITDKHVDEIVRKLRVAFGVVTTDELIDEMVNRFLGWKLPKNFGPDAGISFKPTKPYEGDEFGNSWWPIGTNLLTAEQARKMVMHMLRMPTEK